MIFIPALITPKTRLQRFAVLLAIAVAYAALFNLAHIFSFEGIYSSPVWPAAGVAVGSVLLFGFRIWPAVMLGAFAGNLIVAEIADVATLIFCLLLALLATAEALLAALLMRRFAQCPNPLAETRSIMAFFIYGAVLPSLLTACVGTILTTIWTGDYGAISMQDFATWWLGNALGIVLIVPVLLAWGQPDPQVWNRERRVSITTATLLMLSLSLGAFFFARLYISERTEIIFDKRATELSGQVSSSVQNAIHSLDYVHGLFASTLPISKLIFDDYVQIALKNNPSLRAISWNQVVTAAEREDFERRMRTVYQADFHVTESDDQQQQIKAGMRDEYVVVTYIQPEDSNKAALGFDIASDPTRQQALHRAERSGSAVTTGRIELVQHKEPGYAVLLLKPYFRHQKKAAGPEEEVLEGFVTGVFDLKTMMAESIASVRNEALIVNLIDQEGLEGKRLLYSTTTNDTQVSGSDLKGALQSLFFFDVPGREWTLEVIASDQYRLLNRGMSPWLLLVSCFLVSAMTVLLVLLISGQRLLIQIRVNQQTATLREQEKSLRITFDNIKDAVMITDNQGVITQMNLVAECLTGWRSDEAMGRLASAIYTRLDPVTHRHKESPVLQVLSSGLYCYDDALILINRHGKQYHINESVSPIRDENKQVTGVLLTFCDITEKYHSQQELDKLLVDLQASEERFRTMFAKAPLGIAEFNILTGKITDLNLSYAEILHRSLPEMQGVSWMSLSHPDDIAAEQQQVKLLLAGKIKSYHLVKRERCADNSFVWVSVFTVLLARKIPGQPTCLRMIEDTTSRKREESLLLESERRYKALITSSNTGAWEYFSDRDYLWCSAEYFSMLGRDQHDYELSGNSKLQTTWFDLLHPEDRDRASSTFAQYLENPVGMYENKFRMLHSNGSWVWIWSRAKLLLDDAGHPSNRVIGTHIDISKQKTTEEQLQRSQKMEALGKLIGGIAHDFNNMLAVIIGYANLLTLRLSDETDLNFIHEISRAGERGQVLTQKMLNFSCQTSVDAESVAVNTVLRGMESMLETTLTARIHLNLSLANDLWPVWLDSSALEDALLNLSINAAHAMKGKGELSFSTENQCVGVATAKDLQLVPGDYVMLRVSDTGCGMDEATKQRMFDPFFSTKGDQGSGLGLSQVFGFIHSSNGGIFVDTALGKGTSITLCFPRYRGSMQPASLAVDKEQVSLDGTETVLVVDDEPALVKLAELNLSQNGYRVLTADSGQQALTLLAEQPVDLLISDVVMPDMDGHTLAARVKEAYPQVRILLVSGFAENQSINSMDQKLLQGMLHKPYEPKLLLERVRQLLDSSDYPG